MKAVGMGDLEIEIPNENGVTKMTLAEVLYSPEVGYTLVSVGRLDRQGYTVTFGNGKCVICNPSDVYVGSIPLTSQCLYKLVHDMNDDVANAAEELLTIEELHCRLGHISVEAARQLVSKGLVTGVKLDKSLLDNPSICESCIYAKVTWKPVAKVCEGGRAENFGDEVHTDLWGPAPTRTKGGRRYYMTFTDDATRFTHLYLLQEKSEAFRAYREYSAWCETQLNVCIKKLHSDRGGEYLDGSFVQFLKDHSTVQKLTVHDTPAHNGVAERHNRTIVERIRALLRVILCGC